MADEENTNFSEDEKSEIAETEEIIDYQNINNDISGFDWDKAWNITKQIFNYLSIVVAYLGILAILSYPILHIINVFCGIESFMKTLPFGYTASIPNVSADSQGLSNAALITFGVICIFVALKLISWLIQAHSIFSRIFCILFGSGFMYLMINKQANEILMTCVTFIFAIVLLIFVGIPFLIVFHNCIFPVFKGLVPSVFSYYRFLLSFFPNTSGLMKFCEGAKNSVEATNARYAEENRKRQEEYDRKNKEYKVQQAEYEHKKEMEKQERETIGSAIQKGNAVYVYGIKGNLLFTKFGTLKGYTNSTVSIEYNRAISTYNGRGNIINTRY